MINENLKREYRIYLLKLMMLSIEDITDIYIMSYEEFINDYRLKNYQQSGKFINDDN